MYAPISKDFTKHQFACIPKATIYKPSFYFNDITHIRASIRLFEYDCCLHTVTPKNIRAALGNIMAVGLLNGPIGPHCTRVWLIL